MRRSSVRAGFTLLEVMVAMAILAIALGAVFSSEAGSVRMAARARKLGWASMLVRCKMGEIEEQIAKEGFPAIFDEGEDNCCTEAEIEGFTCKWEIEPVSMPDTMFEEGDEEDPNAAGDKDSDEKSSKAEAKLDGKDAKDAIDGTDKSGKKKLDPAELLKDPKKLLGGGSAMVGAASQFGGGSTDGDDGEGPPDMDAIASMAMQYVYPILKPSFESQIRRATVTVMWKEGSAEQKFDVTQYLVADQPIKLPDGTDPNAQSGTDSSSTGTGTGTGTGSGSATQKGLFSPRTDFGLFGTQKGK